MFPSHGSVAARTEALRTSKTFVQPESGKNAARFYAQKGVQLHLKKGRIGSPADVSLKISRKSPRSGEPNRSRAGRLGDQADGGQTEDTRLVNYHDTSRRHHLGPCPIVKSQASPIFLPPAPALGSDPSPLNSVGLTREQGDTLLRRPKKFGQSCCPAVTFGPVTRLVPAPGGLLRLRALGNRREPHFPSMHLSLPTNFYRRHLHSN